MRLCWARYVAFALLAFALLSGQASALERSPFPMARPFEIYTPALRWDSEPKGRMWTNAAMRFITTHGKKLPQTVPRDIQNWCPGYREQPFEKRAAFWAGLLSSLSFHESTWRETAVGGGGLWYGLTQIAPPTADWRKCNVRTGEALKDGVDNLSCAVRIMNITVPRDQVVSEGMRGVAADWGPFHSERKRNDMMRWSRRQEFCAVVMNSSPMPRPRPAAHTVLQGRLAGFTPAPRPAIDDDVVAALGSALSVAEIEALAEDVLDDGVVDGASEDASEEAGMDAGEDAGAVQQAPTETSTETTSTPDA